MNGDLLTNSMCVREYDFQVPYTIDRRKIFCKCRNQFYEKLISENKNAISFPLREYKKANEEVLLIGFVKI